MNDDYIGGLAADRSGSARLPTSRAFFTNFLSCFAPMRELPIPPRRRKQSAHIFSLDDSHRSAFPSIGYLISPSDSSADKAARSQ